MQAHHIEFLELLNGQVQYVVPRWQRRYRWGQADIERLVDDLLTVAIASPDATGLHDMLGNVTEWAADCWHDNYAQAPPNGTPWTRGGDCSRRVVRGGSWGRNPLGLRSAERGSVRGGDRFLGFRVARTLGAQVS